MSSAALYDSGSTPNLVDQLLAEQQSLSAVETFARRHDVGEVSATARVYEERIPAGAVPLPGQQLAFRVDLDACTGCKACVTACHSMNGLSPEETWRDVGLLVGESDGAGFQQTVTTACHHCEDPACLAGCPVQAYEKDPVTGIVRHLDDQCIGCQYCVLKCPYDVPKYNKDLGIVRKCDMCTGRLAEGEAPACVQGCPNGAISIEIVDRAGGGAAPQLLPGLDGAIPDSAYTRPTTRYVSTRRVGALHPADLERLSPASAHDPLAVMLVLMQLSVGTLVFGTLAPGSGGPFALALAAATALMGLGAATFHLGRPVYAFRAFLGWRTSWMSREILVFGVYAPAVALTAAVAMFVFFEVQTSWAPVWIRDVLPWLQATALGSGLVGTVCSVMIYVDTHRPGWRLARTGPVFAGSLIGLGAFGAAGSAALATWILAAGTFESGVPLLLIGILVLASKAGTEGWLLTNRGDDARAASARTAHLLRGPLRARAQLRFALAGVGLVTGAAAVGTALNGDRGLAALLTLGALVAFALGELLERHLYFTAEATPGMPGN